MGTPPNFKCQDYFRIYLVWVVTLSPDNGIMTQGLTANQLFAGYDNGGALRARQMRRMWSGDEKEERGTFAGECLCHWQRKM